MPSDPPPGADATVDVVVVGAGPAGCAAAVTLARDGRSVLIVDSGRAERTFRVGEGAPPGLDQAVDQVFGPDAFGGHDHLRSFANRSAWGSAVAVDTDFMFNPFGPGWHLDRVAFDARLVERAEAAGARIWDGTVRTADARGGPGVAGRWTLQVETRSGGREVDAALVCDASGRRAAFARRHGATLVTHDRLVAAVAVFDRSAVRRPGSIGDDDIDSATTIESVEGGWWYSAAIPGDRRVVAFFTDGDLLPDGIRSADGFRGLVAATGHVGPLVGGDRLTYDLPEPPAIVAAGTSHLDQPTGAGWVAAGDAAACFDPLSSQGTLTAVLMGRTAGDALISLLVDRRAGTDAYESRYRSIMDRFLDEQAATYAVEQRWPDAPFWQRRHAVMPPPPG